MIDAAGWARVSTGSQDIATQTPRIEKYADDNDMRLIRMFKLSDFSASKGEQEKALQDVIADIQDGLYTHVIITDSSRLDRRDVKTASLALWAIQEAGGTVVSIDEPMFGKTDDMGLIGTVFAQIANKNKSDTVKKQTLRGVEKIAANRGHYGPLPLWWGTTGDRYMKQAVAVHPEKISDVYNRIIAGESIMSIARSYDTWPQQVRKLIRYEANHTGKIQCAYKDLKWTHDATPVVSPDVWWQAQRTLDARGPKDGGRPVAVPASFLSGLLDCPCCDGKLYVKSGVTAGGNKRTPKIYCGGNVKSRKACGQFTPVEASHIITQVEQIFSQAWEIFEWRKIAGNTAALDTLRAALDVKLNEPTPRDRAERRQHQADIDTMEDAIEAFVLVPDEYDYAATGRRLCDVWEEADTDARRNMVKAYRDAVGLSVDRSGNIYTGGDSGAYLPDGIVNIGAGLCFKLDGP